MLKITHVCTILFTGHFERIYFEVIVATKKEKSTTDRVKLLTGFISRNKLVTLSVYLHK